MALPQLSQPQIERIARIMADTNTGLTGSEIGHYLAQCRINDTDPTITKWRRLYNAFANRINNDRSTNVVFGFLKHCFEPAHGLDNPERYASLRLDVNQVLMLVGVEIGDDGNIYSVDKAKTVSEVWRRTKSLRDKLSGFNAHPEVLKCCREELLAEDYFHAVQEAAKSLCNRVRELTGLNLDGSALFNTAFSTRNPYLAFNTLQSDSEINQQNGLKEMLNGVVHMVRNVTAHELRIRWDINEKEAIDILSLISYLHKLLEVCVVLK